MSGFVKGTWQHLTRAKDYQLAPICVCHTTEDCQLTDPHKDSADFPKGIIGLFSIKIASIAAQGHMHILVDNSLNLGGNSGVAFDLANNLLFFEAAMH